MTDYERLAADLTAAGIKASVATARGLSERAFYGQPMKDTEARIVAAWEARIVATPFAGSADRGKGS